MRGLFVSQRSFDWRGVAASAAGSAAGSYAKGAGYGSFGRGMARGVASYAATGGNFQRALPGIVGSAIGEHFISSYHAPAASKMERQLQQARQQPQEMSQKQHDFLWSSTAGPGDGITNRSLISSEYERPMPPLPDVVVTANASEIRAMDATEVFFAFNTWGRGLNGTWDGIKNIAGGIKEIGDAAADAIRYPTEALASRILPEQITGQRPYQPVSAVGQSLQQQGLGPTATNMAAGIMRGTAQTVAAPFRAAYLRNDARELGRSLMEVVPLVVGATGALRLRANSVEAAATHPGRLEAESANVSQASLLRALRQADTPESLATAKLISRGKLEVNILPADTSGRGLGGLYRFGTKEIDIYRNAFSTPTQAAGYATHETTHFMQGLTRSNYNLGHEFDAFRAQGAVDSGHWSNGLSDPRLYNLLSTHPAYRGVRVDPKWPR